MWRKRGADGLCWRESALDTICRANFDEAAKWYAKAADQNFVRKVIETLGEDDARLLPDLDKGEALLSGQFINFPVLVKMKEPESRGEREEEDAFVALEKMRAANEKL